MTQMSINSRMDEETVVCTMEHSTVVKMYDQ